jgi:hypothetical protein
MLKGGHSLALGHTVPEHVLYNPHPQTKCLSFFFPTYWQQIGPCTHSLGSCQTSKKSIMGFSPRLTMPRLVFFIMVFEEVALISGTDADADIFNMSLVQPCQIDLCS